MTTMHGLVMVFGAIMPAFVGLANWMIPLQIGAPDMALPRMNNCQLLAAAVRVHAAAVGSFFMPGGAPAGGWTLYPPLIAADAAHALPLAIFADPHDGRVARSWARSTSSSPS